MLDDQSLAIKKEDIDSDSDSDSDNYSVYSNDDRKCPAQVLQTPSSIAIAIKKESDTESVDPMSSECLSREETAPYVAPLGQEKFPHDGSDLATKEESQEREGKQSPSKTRPKRKVRRRLIYDEISYIDTIDNNNNDDDSDENSFTRSSRSRMQRGFNGPRTRDHYHIRTRASKKRTRSDHKTKAYHRRNAGAKNGKDH